MRDLSYYLLECLVFRASSSLSPALSEIPSCDRQGDRKQSVLERSTQRLPRQNLHPQTLVMVPQVSQASNSTRYGKSITEAGLFDPCPPAY